MANDNHGQKTADCIAKNQQTRKNAAKSDILECQNRQDFALNRPFARRFACGTVLQTVSDKLLQNIANDDFMAENLKLNEFTNVEVCHA